MDQSQLRQDVLTHPAGKKIFECIQCGTCSGSCPFAGVMDHGPRELFALVRDGEADMVLRSNTPWFCVSCYACSVRCPRQIPITDIMYTFKQMTMERGISPDSTKMPELYRLFRGQLKKNGRVAGMSLLGRYGLKHPLDMVSKVLLGMRLAGRMRIELSSPKIKHPSHMKNLISSG